MRFGIFYEHQLPRPWGPDDEHRLLSDALEQVELADRAGIDYVWEVEHHFLEEYSHSSAPEVFLAAASQRTSSIRLGHGIVQAPAAVNHPARIAERIATLDLVSDGRVEFGTGEASSAAEPLQKPHPPLWVACSRRETIQLAARSGIEVGSLRGAIGTPAQVTELIARYKAAGVDQLMFVLQSGRNRHEHICESIELFAREVLPRFAEHRAEQEQAKADRLAAAVDRALARRPARRTLPAPYQIDEEAEVAAARRARQRPLRELAGQAAGAARTALSARLQAGPQRLAASLSDARIEKLASGSAAQRAIFGLLASRFDAARLAGFDGTIAFDLGLSNGTRRCWAIEVSGGRARARAGPAPAAAVTIRLALTDFIRVNAGAGSFYALIAEGRVQIDGDLALAGRMGEMFGARPVY